jgi:hypothetical protein
MQLRGDFDLELAVQTGLDAAAVAEINKAARVESQELDSAARVEVAELQSQAQNFATTLAILSNPAALGAVGGLAGLEALRGGGAIPPGGAGGIPRGGLAGLGGGFGIPSFGGRTPTLANLRNLTPAQLQFLEGQAAAGGVTPGALTRRVGAVSLGGGGIPGGTLAAGVA